jgi:prevent-host-death family protein
MNVAKATDHRIWAAFTRTQYAVVFFRPATICARGMPKRRKSNSMAVFDVEDAKRDLSRLLDDALGGQEIVISRDGVEVVRLTPISVPAQRGPRIPGRLKGTIWIAPDFDHMSDDEIAEWEGR